LESGRGKMTRRQRRDQWERGGVLFLLIELTPKEEEELEEERASFEQACRDDDLLEPLGCAKRGDGLHPRGQQSGARH